MAGYHACLQHFYCVEVMVFQFITLTASLFDTPSFETGLSNKERKVCMVKRKLLNMVHTLFLVLHESILLKLQRNGLPMHSTG